MGEDCRRSKDRMVGDTQPFSLWPAAMLTVVTSAGEGR